MTWLLAVLRTKLGRVAAIALAVLAGLGLARSRWRSQGHTDAEQKRREQELEAHDRINEADTGVGATDDERMRELQRLGQEWDGD